jgi:conjugal transfer pilus assembly protein TraF
MRLIVLKRYATLSVLLAFSLSTALLAQNNSLPTESGITDRVSEDVKPKDSQWIRNHAEGWFWRDLDPEVLEPEKIEEEESKPAMVNADSLYPSMNDPLTDPLVTLEALQKAVEQSKARAVLQPTNENLMNWIKVQNELLKKNTLFADNWQRLVWRNPEYDYNQVRPSNPVALKAYSQSYKMDRREALSEISKEYGLYFVIAESCPYCHEMAPYLKRFAENYGFTVITVSVDGGSVPEFPDAMYSPEFAERLGVKITPAIILAKPSEGVIEPISYGFVSLKELEIRIYRLFRMEPGEPVYNATSSRYKP